jgi:hypothetical protein
VSDKHLSILFFNCTAESIGYDPANNWRSMIADHVQCRIVLGNASIALPRFARTASPSWQAAMSEPMGKDDFAATSV